MKGPNMGGWGYMRKVCNHIIGKEIKITAVFSLCHHPPFLCNDTHLSLDWKELS